MAFKLTYSTMFTPPEEMQLRFEAALAKVEGNLGREGRLLIAGKDVATLEFADRFSPIDPALHLGSWAVGGPEEADKAMAAAKAAFPAWRATPPRERLRLLRSVAFLLEERVYEIAAAMVLEVGKNRMEALGETQETADFFTLYSSLFEQADGYALTLPDDPLPDFRSHNRSVLKPHGVWVVIAPFNFPLALAGGPTAAALVTGNTVVLKGSSETFWAGRLLADCLRDAGIPPGVFNYVSGSGGVVGEALIRHPDLAGVTFTGSYEVGMDIYRKVAAGPWPRPCILEMGGKNPCIVTAKGDLERAAAGIVRSAFGMGGQKCSALSRVYVEAPVADRLLELVIEKTRAIKVGDPRLRENWLGPVIHAKAAAEYEGYCRNLREGGAKILVGGERLVMGPSYVAPTIAEAPADHPLFRHEMFLPILMVARVGNFAQALAEANAARLGLTAGCYGSDQEIIQFLDQVETGTLYLNRPQGATTGAWPGYQSFVGWKGSSSTGKAIGGAYYLPQYLREQSHTWVE